MLKNSEIRRCGHLLHGKTCIMTESEWNARKEVSL